jgi:hypothetical protein
MNDFFKIAVFSSRKSLNEVVMNIMQPSPNQQILALVRQMTISDEQFSAFNEKIEKKLAEGDLKAKEEDLQPELNRILVVYKKAIEGHKANLKTQYDLGKKTVQQIEAIDDLSKVMEVLQEFQKAIAPILEVHKKLEEEIKYLEGKIVLLLPVGTQFAL